MDFYFQDHDSILRDLRANMLQTRERMVNFTNRHQRDVTFEVWDLVYLKLQPYRQTTVAFLASLKLSPQFFGPFEVIE